MFVAIGALVIPKARPLRESWAYDARCGGGKTYSSPPHCRLNLPESRLVINILQMILRPNTPSLSKSILLHTYCSNSRQCLFLSSLVLPVAAIRTDLFIAVPAFSEACLNEINRVRR